MAAKREAGRLACSRQTLYDLQNIKTSFENDLKHHELDLNIESDKGAGYRACADKARLYVFHFIQILYMSIERGELKEEVLGLYGLQDLKMKMPPLQYEKELLDWGWKIVEGEQKRMQKGGSPLYNPSIALVKVQMENFRDAAVFQYNLRKNSLRSYEKMQKTRQITNDFISRMWTEIEENITGDSAKHRRQKAQEYGVVYVFRRNEKKKLRSEDLQVDLLFEFN